MKSVLIASDPDMVLLQLSTLKAASYHAHPKFEVEPSPTNSQEIVRDYPNFFEFLKLGLMQETERRAQSVYLRGYEEQYHHSLKVTRTMRRASAEDSA